METDGTPQKYLDLAQAWNAIQDLLGGEERIDEKCSSWGDSFIVNLGTDKQKVENGVIEPRDLDNWHVDGDFFVNLSSVICNKTYYANTFCPGALS